MSTNEPSALLLRVQSLLGTQDLADLGPRRRPNTRSEDELRGLIDSLFLKTGLSTRTQDLIRGTLLLWHDHLDAAHAIAQEIEDPDGSLLHAMMHRREPDYWNSKYWFRRVGQHECYPAVAARVSALLGAQQANLASRLVRGDAWDPFAFVDACQEAAQSASMTPGKKLLQEIQRIEFESFLERLCS